MRDDGYLPTYVGDPLFRNDIITTTPVGGDILGYNYIYLFIYLLYAVLSLKGLSGAAVLELKETVPTS